MDWRYAVKSSNVDGKELRGNGFPLGCADKYFVAQMMLHILSYIIIF